MNWTAKIIALKVLDDDRSGYISWTIDALNYLCTLIDQHPEMTLAAVNLSLGGWQSNSPEEMISSNDPSYLAYKALSDKNKAVICVAAGNESCEVGKPVNGMYVYPASFKNIANMIVVANAQNDSTYSKSSSSNYSTTYVDIAAPGTEILSTTPGNEYLSYSGTSMATPHVSGVAALLKSIFPEATASQIKAAINKGANGKYAKDYTAKGLLDAKKALQTLQETVATNLPPQILTTSLPSGLTDDAYDLRLSAKGARPMTWSITSGKLPDGLTLSQDGRISGTPTKAGTFTFTLKATNSKGNASKEFTIAVTIGKPEITTSSSLPDGSITQLYSQKLTAKGLSPITWSIAGGSLPTSFTLASDGTLKGAPSKRGTWTFSVKATNRLGSSTKNISVKIKGIAPSKHDDYRLTATTGKAFTKKLEAIGTAPLTWSITKGTLPPGLALNATTGVISGTPKKPGKNSDYYKLGMSTFTVKAANSEGSCLIDCVMVVNDPSTSSDIKILTDELPLCIEGLPYSLKLEASGTSPITWTVGQPLNDTEPECFPLPDGITLKTDGTISGKFVRPDQLWHSEINRVRIVASNKKGSVSKYFDFRCTNNDDKIHEVLTKTLLDALTGKYYEQPIFISTVHSYGIDIISGSLPPGVVLYNPATANVGGMLKGTPSTAGTYTFTVRIDTGECNTFLTKKFTLTVRNTPAKPVITTKSLPVVAVGIPCRFVFSCTGTASVDWTVSGLPNQGQALPYGFQASIYGLIEGTPEKAGTYTVKATVRNSAGSDTKTFTFKAGNDTTPKLAAITLPAGTKGITYTAQLTAAGLTPMTWRISGGSLPMGLSLSSSGKISGVPEENGSFTFTVEASNIAGTSTRELTLNIGNGSAPRITTGKVLQSVSRRQAYSVTLSADGTAPITWEKVSGELPLGLTLSSKGKISGTPTVSGNYSFKVRASNTIGSTSETFTLKVTQTTISGNLAGTLTRKASYSKVLKATGGLSPYTWSVSSGSLPDGMKLGKSSGKISGAPTKAGTFKFTVKAKDVNGAAGTKAYTITVTQTTISGKITATLTRKASYSKVLKATGGFSPYTWSVSSGSLPDGMKLGKSSGKISGAPTKAGTFKFTVKAKDPNGAAGTKSYTITVTQTTVSGKIAASLPKNTSYSKTLKATGGASPYTWTVSSGQLPTGLKLGKSSGKISGIPTKKGTFTFTIKAKDANGAAGTKTYTVKVTAATSTQSVEPEGTNGTPSSGKPDTTDLPATPESPGTVAVVPGNPAGTFTLSATLNVASDDILEAGEGRDSDLITVRAGKALTFILGDWGLEVSGVTVYVDDEPAGAVTVSEDGTFTLPAEMVAGDFKVCVKATHGGSELESETLYIISQN